MVGSGDAGEISHGLAVDPAQRDVFMIFKSSAVFASAKPANLVLQGEAEADERFRFEARPSEAR
ncbi:hypothetical protein [Altererythrobacter sp. MF3-039]|uniref:hypothetical protein n=1 Tax=Altererythrobacter sp. MF3-039 TaxID=3252901 RepID=UPI00390C8AF8